MLVYFEGLRPLGFKLRAMDPLGTSAALVAFAAYYNTLDAGFVYDDT